MLVLINMNMRLTCSDVNMISHHIINMVVGLCYNVVPINILLKWSTVLMAYNNQPFFLSLHVYVKVTLVGFSDSVASLEVPGLRAMISLQLLSGEMLPYRPCPCYIQCIISMYYSLTLG